VGITEGWDVEAGAGIRRPGGKIGTGVLSDGQPVLVVPPAGALHQDRRSLLTMAFDPDRDRQQGET
jgi:hypothetical protein